MPNHFHGIIVIAGRPEAEQPETGLLSLFFAPFKPNREQASLAE
jgi:hypothetical protein